MASDHNLIDFSDVTNNTDKQGEKIQQSTMGATPTPTTSNSSVAPKTISDNVNISINLNSGSVNPVKTSTTGTTNKPNKSLFEITRVESNHDENNVGGEDSEMDDSVSSSTSILDQISKDIENEKKELAVPQKTKVTDKDDNNTNVGVTLSNTNPANSSNTQPGNNNTSVPNLQHQTSVVTTTSSTSATQPTEPQSRFRIVKIAKPKPYEKGTWMVNDFNETQKQEKQETSTDTAPSSPAVKRNRNPLSDSGGGVTSPTEPIKTKSSEFLAQNFSNVQSRGSSYNTNGDRRSSVESTTVSESGSGTPLVTPMVNALEVALEQIQNIRDSMVSSVSDEVKKLKEIIDKVQADNTRLKEENDSLKKKLSAAEDRIALLEKG